MEYKRGGITSLERKGVEYDYNFIVLNFLDFGVFCCIWIWRYSSIGMLVSLTLLVANVF